MGNKVEKQESKILTYNAIYPDDNFFRCKDKSRFKNTDVIGIQYNYEIKMEENVTKKTPLLFKKTERNTVSSCGGTVFCNEKRKIKRVIQEINEIPDDVNNKQKVLEIINLLDKIEIERDLAEDIIESYRMKYF